MGGEEVHLGLHHLGAVAAEEGLQAVAEGQGLEGLNGPKPGAGGELPVQGLPPHEAQEGPAQGVVHGGVKHVPLEPGVGLLPDLPHEVGLGVRPLHPKAELPPEGGVGDFIGHVQPPAVCPEAHPVLGHGEEVLPHRRGLHLELGELGVAPPGLVVGPGAVGVQGKPLHVVPVPVGARLPVFQKVLEGEKPPSRVVEDPVQDDPYPVGVGHLQEVAKRGVPPQEGIYLEVVHGVVAVVGRGGEDGVEVDGLHPEVQEVGELLRHPPKRPPLEAPEARGGLPGLEGAAGGGLARGT